MSITVLNTNEKVAKKGGGTEVLAVGMYLFEQYTSWVDQNLIMDDVLTSLYTKADFCFSSKSVAVTFML